MVQLQVVSHLWKNATAALVKFVTQPLSSMTSPVIYALLAALPAVVYYLFIKPRSTDSATPATTSTLTAGTTSEKPQTIMQTERTDLEPPKDDPFTLEDLKAFDGSDPSKPIYVAIKGPFAA